MEQEGDQLSNLPITILHNVLSRLPEKDAARTSVLSKAWLEIWYTFPILSFHDSRFVGQSIKPIKNTAERSSQTGEDLPRKNKDFIEYVKRTLLRFWDQKLAIKEFSLVLNQHPYMSNDVDLCLKLASESNVEVLTLRLPDGSNQGDDEGRGECYVLPKGVIEVKSLNKLELIGGIRVDQAFMNHSIKFFLLRVLYLSHVVVEDKQAIERLISCCPLVEFISLFFSNGGMQSLRMQGLQKLKLVEVQRIEEVYIDEASSQLKLHYYNEYLNTPFKIDFIRCENLKELRLSLKKTILTDKWFLELFKKFPFLEKLDLWNCTMSEKINISSVQLKSFVLSSCSNSKEVNIDAPNLLSCEFDGFGSSKSIISFLRSSSQLEVHVDISTPYYFDVYRVREVLQNIKPQNVMISLYLSIVKPIRDPPNPILDISTPPPSIKQLHIQINSSNYETNLFPDLLHFLLLCCCPTTISFRLETYNIAFIQFLCEKFERRKDDDCFCSFNDTKCWLHDVKSVEIATTMKNIDDNFDLKTVLETLPTFEFHYIIFILEF